VKALVRQHKLVAAALVAVRPSQTTAELILVLKFMLLSESRFSY
jgi:hypothetical protein